MPDLFDKDTDTVSSENSSENQPDFRNFELILKRLMIASECASETELSRALGIKQPSITGARKRGVIPSGWIITIAQQNGVSADWLLFGTGGMRRPPKLPNTWEKLGIDQVKLVEKLNEISKKEQAEQAQVAVCDPEIMLIPKVKARLSAGGGSMETNGEVAGYYAFRTEFLKRKGNSSKMVLMDVSGDSMEPEIKSGDSVLIDESQTEIIAGSIYAVGMDEEVVVKVVDKAPGKLILRSYNTLFAPYELDMRGDLSTGVRIIGRVIWWCREAR